MTTDNLSRRATISARAFVLLFFALSAFSSSVRASYAESPVAFPERNEPDLRTGFENPPAGYGEVPFWWWTGERLDVERLNWQLDELKKKGISGVQVNYAHQDVVSAAQPNWLTFPNEPEVMTEDWYSVFDKVREHCRELGMGIGLSGYTLDWQNSPGNLFDRLVYSDVELQSQTLYVARKADVRRGERYSDLGLAGEDAERDGDVLAAVVAYPSGDFSAAVVLTSETLASAAEADFDGQIWVYRAKRVAHTLNPLHPESGKRVVERFFQPFETRAQAALGAAADETSTLGLEYFFHDELQLGTGNLIWYDDLPSEFTARKGYSLWTALPAMFDADAGDLTEKYRLDYMDVRVRLAEERYFIPLFNWNARRGRVYACDPGSRGKDPSEFGDYFSAIRWYTAPGHDTPGGYADFVKNKVSSSIAHFYHRPRVWLEGYHSFGWGATPERLLFATNENFLFGANLLNLHGLYYTTYGGYWEWAPPCYHFRQPYWETFGSFLKYFERLSFALTRGTEAPDFVVLYPVSAYQSGHGGPRARDVAFEAARRIFDAGHDVLFIDDDSIARAEIVDGRLSVAGASHRVLVLPSIRGIRIQTLLKARELCEAGGTVIVLDALPEATDAGGRQDPALKEILSTLFAGGTRSQSVVRTSNGGAAAFFSGAADADEGSSKGDKIGSKGTISKLREYPGGFSGHWAWSSTLDRDVRCKWVVSGLTEDAREYSALFLCDNSGALYVNGKETCRGANYSEGWRGTLSLRNGDVVTLDCHDDDAPRYGSAGFFFALSDGEKTLATSENFRCESGTSDAAWRESADVAGLFDVDVGNVHVLHRTGVNSEAAGAAAVVAGTDDRRMWDRLAAFLEEYPRDVVDAGTNAPCAAMKRVCTDSDVYFVMKGKKGAALTFRTTGRAELYNAWDGTRRTLKSMSGKTAEGEPTTTILWPYAEDQAGLVVFWRDEEPLEGVVVPKPATGAKRSLALDGEWDFELIPTLDNQWGDFRLPVHDQKIGAEAQRFDVVDANGVVSHDVLNDFSPKYYALGPFPTDAGLAEVESRLSALTQVDPKAAEEFNGKSYSWKTGAFSWRWGIEGNPGRQGYHGLKERIDSRFIALGALADAHNEKVYVPEEGGNVYYLWTTACVKFAESEADLSNASVVDVYVGGGAPSTLWVAGRLVLLDGSETLIADPESASPVLMRFDSAGRRSCVFVERGINGAKSGSRYVDANGQDNGAYNGLTTGLREETPDFVSYPDKRTPLSTVWFDTPGTLDFDVRGSKESTLQRLSFDAPPGLVAMRIVARGVLDGVYADGAPVAATVKTASVPGGEYWRGLTSAERESDAGVSAAAPSDKALCVYEVVFERPLAKATRIETRIASTYYGAAIFPEPIRLECSTGVTTLGDWNDRGVLANYSGGARYSRCFETSERLEEAERAILDLGTVGASCRVRLNGRLVGDLATPPNRLDVTEYLAAGANLVEVEVYNTAANQWRNIPTNYGAIPPSGLIGPVFLEIESAE